MKLAFACPYYGPTQPLHGDSVRANIINAHEKGHVWVDDYSVSGTQHRNACEVMTYKAAHDPRIDAVFWTEHDVVLSPDTVSLLCESLEATPDADMMTGIAFRRCTPFNPMVANLDHSMTREQYDKLPDSPDLNVRRAHKLMSYEEMKDKVLMSIQTIDSTAPPFPVDASSLCAVLFRKSVFEKVWDVPDLWAVDAHGFFSIDNAFFLRLKDRGLKLYCDPRVLTGHLGDPEFIDVSRWMEHTLKVQSHVDLHRQQKLRKEGTVDRIYGELTRLADYYKTDKGTLDHAKDSGWYGWIHRYTDFYETMLDPIRLTARKVLEIGVWSGGSLQMWRDYFPKAQVHGIDVDMSRVKPNLGERIHLHDGDVMDEAFLHSVLDAAGDGQPWYGQYHPGFDLIVDDGSHVMEEQQVTLARLFPYVKPGGWYILEDLQTSFTAIQHNPGGPFGLEPDGSNATLKVVEALCEGLPFESRYMTPEQVAYLREHVAWGKVYGAKSITSMLQKRR